MKKRNKSAKMLLFVCLFLVVGLLGGQTVRAFFVHRDKQVNTFTVGENRIASEELFDRPELGEKTVKEPWSVNTGPVDCYVRARIVLSDSRAEAYLDYVKETDCAWEESEDGWLYYKPILKKNERTEPLFTHIVLSEELPEECRDFTIDIMFESVQAEGFQGAAEAFSAIAQDIKDTGV